MFLTLNYSFANVTLNGEPEFVNKVSSWVNGNIKYPQSAIDSRTQGTVYLSFEVIEGEIENIKIIQGVSEDLDEEVISTFQKIPASTLGNYQTEDNTYILPVKFEIK